MRITIVIDDADAVAATQAAQTISRAFVRTDSSEPTSGPDTARPAGPPAPVVDVDVGPAPQVDVRPPTPSGSTPGSGSGSGSGGNGSQPATPNRPAPPTGESAGAAPELGGG